MGVKRKPCQENERCWEMSRDVGRCLEMSGDLGRCREMSGDVKRLCVGHRKLSWLGTTAIPDKCSCISYEGWLHLLLLVSLRRPHLQRKLSWQETPNSAEESMCRQNFLTRTSCKELSQGFSRSPQDLTRTSRRCSIKNLQENVARSSYTYKNLEEDLARSSRTNLQQHPTRAVVQAPLTGFTGYLHDLGTLQGLLERASRSFSYHTRPQISTAPQREQSNTHSIPRRSRDQEF